VTVLSSSPILFHGRPPSARTPGLDHDTLLFETGVLE
jgi:hypothetical protein